MALLESLRRDAARVVLMTVLALSLSLNVFLGWKVSARGGALEPDRLAVGSRVAPLSVTAGGTSAPTELRFDEGLPTVMYVLSPDCHWCRRNENNIRTLAERSPGFRFIGLTSSTAPSGDARPALPFPVYTLSPADLKRNALKIRGTPEMIVVGGDGTVTRVWAGAFAGDTEDEIEAFFKVDLPGLRPDEARKAG